MMDLPDRKLLERYLADRDEVAFGTLLDRHLTLVHGVARRVTGSEDLGRDIAQATFLRLARRAALIPASVSLPAWLHRTAHSLAADLVRGEVRRKKRERLVAATIDMHAHDHDIPDEHWDALGPVIDRLVDSLPGQDREIVLARFYRNESHAAVASRLGVSESLARKRSSRALEKLRAMLGKRGIATTTSALAAMLPAHAFSFPAPAALTGAILQAAQGVTPLLPGACHGAYLLMSVTQKVLIGTAAMVFLASLGYAIRPVETATSFTASAFVPGSSGALAAGLRGSRPGRIDRVLPTTGESRRKRFDQILAIQNAAKRRREMLAFVDLLQPGQFEELCAAFPAGNFPPDPAKVNLRPEQEILVAAWAQKDPEGALARLNPGWMNFSATLLAIAMGAIHPQSALQWANEMPTWREYFLGGLGKVDLPAAMGAIHELPEEERGRMLHYVWANMSGEPELLERMVALLEPGPDRTYLLRKVSDMEASYRPASALAALKSDPEGMQQADMTRIFQAYAGKDPEAAIAALADLPEGAVRRNAVIGAAQTLVYPDPARAFALLDRYPEAASDSLVATLVSYGFFRGHEEQAMPGLERINDPAVREREQLAHLRGWQQAKPEQAQAWIEAHSQDLPPAVLQGLNAAAASPTVVFRPLESP